MNCPYFPSVEDIKAAYGGTVTRLGNKVLWSPNNRSSFKIQPTCLGFTLTPFFTRADADIEPWNKPKAPKQWWECANWAYKDQAIADEFGLDRSTVGQRRRKINKGE